MSATPNADKQARLAKRRELRQVLRPFTNSSFAIGLGLVSLDIGLYVSASIAVLLADSLLWKAVASVGIGIAIARLFVLGHDAGHHSLTPSRALNNFLARLTMLPSYSCLSLWKAGHNVAHHGFAGLRGRDIPWVPLSPEEYLSRSRASRWLYRVYRSWWGAGIYYGIDLWWKQMIFPAGKIRRAFLLDSILVATFLAFQVAVCFVVARLTDQSFLILALFGLALPFVLWLYLAAIVFFVHHTDVDSRWYGSESEWRMAQPDLEGTRWTRLPLRCDALFHHALEHTAHHVDPSIPSYRLSAAQAELAKRYPSEVGQRTITLRRYLAITQQCQLYDYGKHRWLTIEEVERAPVVAAAR